MKNSETLEQIAERQEIILAAIGTIERRLDDLAALIRKRGAEQTRQGQATFTPTYNQFGPVTRVELVKPEQETNR